MENYTGEVRPGATASAVALPIGLRRHREKVFGRPAGTPLDRNAKVRIKHYARSYNARHKQPRQHIGPLTRVYLDVLDALLFGWCNERDGRCFPSYENIAAKANCGRSQVYEAIKALEAAGILTWVNCLTKILVKAEDLFGVLQTRWQVIRTSNAYCFRDPLPCAPSRQIYESENQSGPESRDLFQNGAPTLVPDKPKVPRASLNSPRHMNALKWRDTLSREEQQRLALLYGPGPNGHRLISHPQLWLDAWEAAGCPT